MFRQVVATLLTLARDNADRWLGVHGSHDVPVYGFERYAEPPPVEVDTLRLLSQFHAGSLTLSDSWRRLLAPGSSAAVIALAAESGPLAERAAHRFGRDRESGGGSSGPGRPSTDELSDAVAAFHFPDALWARVVYDLLVAAGFGAMPVQKAVAAFVPIYFGRVASLVIETRRLADDQAEECVERQAREFEAQKPYLVERWTAAAAAADAHGVPPPADAGSSAGPADGRLKSNPRGRSGSAGRAGTGTR
jgi:hypothetical protein